MDMLPLCSVMIGVAKGIAGLGALFYIAYRVWQSLARAEPIDVYPLLRPFALGLCIMFFPTIVIGTFNGVLSPIVRGTHQLLESQKFDMRRYQQQKDQLEREIRANHTYNPFFVPNEEFDRQLNDMAVQVNIAGIMSFLYDGTLRDFLKRKVRKVFRELLELVFNAAALIIDTLRTFILIVLTILGPLAFAFAVYDGFQGTLTQWISRYVSVYLWLPVADLFSTILARLQVLMIQNDIQRLQNNANLVIDSTDVIYIVFLLIGIVGYFTIPTVANWVIQTSTGNFSRNVNKAGAFVGGAAGAAAGNITGHLKKIF
jgi:conjugative transposon TraJ protein